MTAALTLLGIVLARSRLAEVWQGSRGPFRATVLAITTCEPKRFVAYVMLDPGAPAPLLEGDASRLVELASGHGGTAEVAIAACELSARERLRGLLELRGEGPWLELEGETAPELPDGYAVREEPGLFENRDGRIEERNLWGVYREDSRLSYQLTRKDAVRVAWELAGTHVGSPHVDVDDALSPIEVALSEPCS